MVTLYSPGGEGGAVDLSPYAPLASPTFTGTGLGLPNNTRINGVEHFYQTTKPTVRGDSSALVTGDRWYKSDDGTEWFWNGTYWLSSTLDSFTGALSFASGTTQIIPTQYIPMNKELGYVYFFLESVFRRCPFIGDVTDYWSFEVNMLEANSGFNVNLIPAINLQSSPTNHGTQSANILISGSASVYQPRSFIATLVTFGNAPYIVGASITFCGRQVFP